MMNSENASKEIVKSFTDLANIAKGLMDENQQPSFQDKINQKDCSAVQRGGGSGGESR